MIKSSHRSWQPIMQSWNDLPKPACPGAGAFRLRLRLAAAVEGAIGPMEGTRQGQEQVRQAVKQSSVRASVALRQVPPK